MTGNKAASPASAGPVPTRVVLADDQDLVRAGLRLVIDRAPGLTVVGEAATGCDAVRLAREARADVVLMDIRMPGLDGLAATRRIAADDSLARVRVLILTTFEVDEYVFEAVRSGASGFLGKGARPDVLIDAIRTVAHGDALLSPSATRGLIARFLRLHDSEPVRASPLLATLTDREREVVALIAEGMSNTEIARQLTLSPLTVKTHANHAMTKLGARDRAQLVVLAYQTGLARAPRPGRELPRRREDAPERRAGYCRGIGGGCFAAAAEADGKAWSCLSVSKSRRAASMSSEETRHVVAGYVAALRRGDIDALRASFTQKATWTIRGDIPVAGTWTGPGEILDGFLARLTAALDPAAPVTQDLHRIIADGDCAVAEWTSAPTRKSLTGCRGLACSSR